MASNGMACVVRKNRQVKQRFNVWSDFIDMWPRQHRALFRCLCLCLCPWGGEHGVFSAWIICSAEKFPVLTAPINGEFDFHPAMPSV